MTKWDVIVKIWLSLICAFISGTTSATMSSTSFAMLAVLPPAYTGAMMSGQGVAGILIAAFKLCINFWWYPNAAHNRSMLMVTGELFFGVSSLIVIGVALATFILMNSEFFKHYISQSNNASTSIYVIDDTIMEPPRIFPVLKKIKWDGANVFHIFLLTLTIFPGFTTKIRNYNPELSIANNNLILISIFPIIDVVGRTLPKWIIFPTSPDKLWIPTWSRVIFIPLFFICIYTDWFPYNEISYIFMVVFALTNGYFSTLCMMAGPMRVPLGESQKLAGSFMGFFLQFGIFLGVHVAIILLLIIEGPNAVIGE